MDIKKYLDFIGLSGVSLFFNGAYIHSRVYFPEGAFERNRPLYGQSHGKAEPEIFYTNDDAPNGGQFQAAMHIRRYSSLKVYNAVFAGWPYGLVLDRANAGAVVKNVVFAGRWKDFKDEDSDMYFQTASLCNRLFDSTSSVVRLDVDYAPVDPMAIAGAGFADADLVDSFFTKVSYKGAFDSQNDWMNWDPQHTDY